MFHFDELSRATILLLLYFSLRRLNNPETNLLANIEQQRMLKYATGTQK